MASPDELGEFDDAAAWIAIVVVFAACLGGAAVLAEWPLWGIQPEISEEPRFVEPTENGTALWPYTARTRSFESRTLGINMVFYGDSRDIRTALTERSERRWTDERSPENEADAATVSTERIEIDPDADDVTDAIVWTEARGAIRYTHFRTDDGGVWIDESYQLHAGTYLGHRTHIRAYEDPAGEWTAVQIHEEHWDWFRLRHTVTGISESQRELEDEFMGDPAVRAVVRMPFENGTADGDGWASGIYLAAVSVLLFGLTGRLRTDQRDISRFVTRRRHELGLGIGLFGLYTAVRWLGIASEALLSVSPKVVAAPLYLALVVGTPAIAVRFGTDSDRTWAFTAAILGLGAALAVDLVAMGVSVLPLRIILHRAAVLLAVGLIAVGGSIGETQSDRSSVLLVGIVAWMLVIAASLFGYV